LTRNWYYLFPLKIASNQPFSSTGIQKIFSVVKSFLDSIIFPIYAFFNIQKFNYLGVPKLALAMRLNLTREAAKASFSTPDLSKKDVDHVSFTPLRFEKYHVATVLSRQ